MANVCNTTWKCPNKEFFSGPYFPVFSPNTVYSVRIQEDTDQKKLRIGTFTHCKHSKMWKYFHGLTSNARVNVLQNSLKKQKLNKDFRKHSRILISGRGRATSFLISSTGGVIKLAWFVATTTILLFSAIIQQYSFENLLTEA